MEERRKYPRITRTLPLKLSDSEFDVLTESKNISGCGVYCSVDKSIPIMTKLDIVLLVPIRKSRGRVVKKINCCGVLVRSEYLKDNGKHSYTVGIYFNEISEKDRKVLLSYINSFRNKRAFTGNYQNQ
ncbi:MAG: PilZ domain-containing protein [Candidatus Omnitrophota bacterium]|nr:MAG: PilZ domain-containing protein [Candidatus Omnitrophota bacterium]